MAWGLALVGVAVIAVGLVLRAQERTSPSSAEAAWAPTPSPPDLVVVLVGDLRADALAPVAPSAVLAALGRPAEATFTRAYAQSVNPYVSLVSVLSGRYPSAIPLCGVPVEARRGEEPWCARVPADVPLLPGILGLYGYTTALVEGGRRAGDHAALGLGGAFGGAWASSTPDLRAALGWWGEHADQPRLLVWVDALADALSAPGTPPREELVAAYTAALSTRLGLVAQLLDGLDAAPVVRPLRVAVTSTQGLSLGETTGARSLPGAAVHHDVTLERTLHVPLFLLGRDGAGDWGGDDAGQVGRIVQLADLLPTLCRLAGAVPPAGLAGSDLLVGTPPEEPFAYAEFGDMLALRQGAHLLVGRTFHHGTTSLDAELTARVLSDADVGGTYTLHDVEADPAQLQDLSFRSPEVLAHLRTRMRAIRSGPGAPPPEALTPERLQAIQAVQTTGYW